MAARGRKRPAPKKSLKTKLKQDPTGTVKAEVNKTGWFKYIIGATILGAYGGSRMAAEMRQIPIVGGVLSAAAQKGSNLVSKTRR